MAERRICVSVASDDGEKVKLGHFGDARFYLHYAWEDGGWRLVRKIENPYRGEHHHEHGEEEEEEHHHHHHGHGHGGKREKIYELNKDCTAIVATAFGPGGGEYMERRGLKVIKVKPWTTVEEALRIAARELGLEAKAPTAQA